MCKWQITFLALFCLVAGYCSAQNTIRDRSTGKSFPMTVSFQAEGKDYNLEATGVSTRKKFFVKVYSVAHYMEDPTSVKGEDVYDNILRSNKAKQLTSVWVRNVNQKKVQNGYRESFGKILSSQEMSQLKADMDKYLDFFGDVHTDDQHVIRWLPDGTVTVEINGEMKGSVNNPTFARALWSVWFGKKSVVKRDQLVSQIK